MSDAIGSLVSKFTTPEIIETEEEEDDEDELEAQDPDTMLGSITSLVFG